MSARWSYTCNPIMEVHFSLAAGACNSYNYGESQQDRGVISTVSTGDTVSSWSGIWSTVKFKGGGAGGLCELQMPSRHWHSHSDIPSTHEKLWTNQKTELTCSEGGECLKEINKWGHGNRTAAQSGFKGCLLQTLGLTLVLPNPWKSLNSRVFKSLNSVWRLTFNFSFWKIQHGRM